MHRDASLSERADPATDCGVLPTAIQIGMKAEAGEIDGLIVTRTWHVIV